MACSFRGAGSPSSLEIQWWYIKAHQDWQQKPPHMTNVSHQGKQLGAQPAARVCAKVQPNKQEKVQTRTWFDIVTNILTASLQLFLIDYFDRESFVMLSPFSVVHFQPLIIGSELLGQNLKLCVFIRDAVLSEAERKK